MLVLPTQLTTPDLQIQRFILSLDITTRIRNGGRWDRKGSKCLPIIKVEKSDFNFKCSELPAHKKDKKLSRVPYNRNMSQFLTSRQRDQRIEDPQHDEMKDEIKDEMNDGMMSAYQLESVFNLISRYLDERPSMSCLLLALIFKIADLWEQRRTINQQQQQNRLINEKNNRLIPSLRRETNPLLIRLLDNRQLQSPLAMIIRTYRASTQLMGQCHNARRRLAKLMGQKCCDGQLWHLFQLTIFQNILYILLNDINYFISYYFLFSSIFCLDPSYFDQLKSDDILVSFCNIDDPTTLIGFLIPFIQTRKIVSSFIFTFNSHLKKKRKNYL